MSTTLKRPSRRGRRLASARINLRVPPEVKGVLVRAARLQQVKLTEFMVRASQAAAETALAERTRFVLSAQQWREFNAALDAPLREIPALRKLLSEPSVFEPQ